MKSRPSAIERQRRMKLLPGEFKGNTLAGAGYLAIRSHAEVGRIMGITREAVRQIERMAKWKIRMRMADFIKENMGEL